jgi:hypothetical protein
VVTWCMIVNFLMNSLTTLFVNCGPLFETIFKSI